MRRFDFAGEVSKQLIAISSAIVSLVVIFSEKFFSKDWYVFYFVFGDLIVFIVSIIMGVLSIGALVTLVERQERREANADSKVRKTRAAGRFICLADSTAMKLAKLQQGLFAFGLVMFIFIAVVDRMNGHVSIKNFPAGSTEPFPYLYLWPPRGTNSSG